MKKIKALILIFALTFSSLGFLCSCNTVKTKTFFALDTAVQLTVYNCTDEILNKAVNNITKLADALDCYKENGELYNLNKTGKSENLSEDLYTVLKKSSEYSKNLNGAFNITLGAVTRLWNFENKIIPKENELKSALKTVKTENLSVFYKNGKYKAKLKNNTKLDLGAVAKGYIADKTAELLKNNGVKKALINLGGNVYSLGDKNAVIGIKKPFSNGELSARVKVKTSCSAVTAGNYERCFKENGVLYHHILNPKTGKPANSDVNSVTVFCKESAKADAYSTGLFNLGKDKALEIANSEKEIEVVIIDKNDKFFYSDGFELKNGELYIINENI